MIKVIVIGAAGRMGKRLVNLIMESHDMKLSGATEYPESPLLGQDVGLVAGCGSAGVKISNDLKSVVKGANALIDFSTGPVVENAKLAVAAGCAVVIGTTALSPADKAELKKLANSGGRIVLSSNMSIGVNMLSKLCAVTAKTLGKDYDIEIVEMHHNKKKDAPSGTALMLAESIVKAKNVALRDKAVYGREGMTGERKKGEIGIHAVRGGDVVGDHTVIFAADGERIELIHKASSRDTFAKGALRAVRFLHNATPGLYNMQDVLGLN